jgi:hypothetical protein
MGKLGDDLCLCGPRNTVRGKHGELRVIGGMIVTEEEYPGAFLYLVLKKPLDIRYNAACPLTSVKGISLLKKATHHIDYQNGIRHST